MFAIYSEFHNNSIDVKLDFVGYEACQPSHYVGPTIRSNFVLHYIISGFGYFQCYNKTYKLGPGSIFLINPNVSVYYRPDPENPWAYYWIGLDGNKVGEFFRYNQLIDVPCLEIKNKNMQEKFLTCIKSMVHRSAVPKIPTNVLLKNFSDIYEIFALLNEIAPTQPKQKNSRSFQLFLEIKDYILKAYELEISVNSISLKFNLNRSYLTELFHKYEGRSVKQFIMQLRMDRSKFLLKYTNEPIAVIAAGVGYRDALGFSKIFKTYNNCSPTQYREQNKHD